MYKPEELLNAILLCSPDGYIASDEKGRITFVNETVERVTGWTSGELIGKNVSELYSLPESFVSGSSTAGDNGKAQVAILRRRDGKKIPLKARLSEINSREDSSRFNGYLVVLHTDTPVDSNVDRAQFEFVSTVSHELRTPLTSIKGFIETLLRSGDKLSEENKKKYITIVKEQAERLIRLVEDLLAVSRLESQSYQLTIRSIDVKKAINKVCDSLATKAAGHELRIEIEDGIPNILADADKLEQILTNLIDNAIKYSPKDSLVSVKAATVLSEGGEKNKIKIEIADQGEGINESDLSKIFTKFGRLDNPLTRQTEGTGLGLFITKALVLALKGEISVASKPGETKFIVILPAAVSSQAIPLSGGTRAVEGEVFG
jgi:two-component system phosphate regulon sensor histidine kinase PhoR